MDANFNIMEPAIQASKRQKRQDMDKQYTELRTRYHKASAAVKAQADQIAMADNTVEGKRNKRDGDTREVAMDSKNKLNQQDS